MSTPSAGEPVYQVLDKSYLDRISELLLKEHLRDPQLGVEARKVTRTRTVSTLIQLDGRRARTIFVFLREAQLLEESDPILSFKDADLSRAAWNDTDFSHFNLSGTNLSEADLFGADLSRANLSEAELGRTDLSKAYLFGADLSRANLSEAELSGANLNNTQLIQTNLTDAILTHCSIYGASVWNVQLEGTQQESLIITYKNEPTITVDNLEIAQFIHLLLNNQNIRQTIDTITSQVVLILGSFPPDRKAMIDALSTELHRQKYSPVVFNLEGTENKDVLATVRTLAHMARFVLLDLTHVDTALHKIIDELLPHCIVPIQPLLLEDPHQPRYERLLRPKYRWVLPPHHYKDLTHLQSSFQAKVLQPINEKIVELKQKNPFKVFLGYAPPTGCATRCSFERNGFHGSFTPVNVSSTMMFCSCASGNQVETYPLQMDR